ncbi:MAG: DUF4270 domain-containing protein [Candidatus Symbiothrix sp.]|jgi:hypothetical protein|nr:DUF4270 domain-containing protein [Candidatus Symbiothrix sp.]
MKTKLFLSGILLSLIYLVACEDTIDNIGMGILPDDDKIQIFTYKMSIEGETVKADSIYAKSIYGTLGQFYDPDYGKIKAGYLCQYYPTGGFDSIVGDEITDVQLKIMYSTYTGDSLAPMEVSVYPVIKPLVADYYSNINPADFCDMNSLLGKQTYTARDLNISDSLNLANLSTNYKVVSVPLPKDLGNLLLNEWKKPDHGVYAPPVSPDALAKIFPGTYLASTFGNDCLLNVEQTAIFIYYKREHHQPSVVNGTDSMSYVTGYSILNVTKEVTQLNIFENENTHLADNTDPDKMYLKTPAGVFSQVSIPLKEIREKIGTLKFSNVKLTLHAYPKEDREYALAFPGLGKYNSNTLTVDKLLLIEPDSVKSFFETQKMADNLSTYYTTFNSTTSTYTFSNISNVLQHAIDRPDVPEYLNLWVIPVQVAFYYYTDSYSYTQTPQDYSTANYLYPSAVTLKRGEKNGEKNLEIEIVATDLQR